MAFADTQTVSTAASNMLHLLARPFAAVGSVLVGLAKSSAHAEALDDLARITDDQLTAQGTTREAQMASILRGYMHV